jgi:predicted MFS family arabinose efflux permease
MRLLPSPGPTRPGVVHLAVILTLAMAVGTVLPSMIGALGPLIIRDLGLSRVQLGGLITSVSLTATLLSPVAGRLIDRSESRRIILLMLGAAAVAWSSAGLSRGYFVLLLAALLGGVSQAISNPITNRLLWVHTPVNRRSTLFGTKQSGVQFGVALAAFVPLLATAIGWRPALLTVAVLPVLLLPWWARALPIDPPAAPVEGAGGALPMSPIVLWMTAHAAFMGAGMAAMIAYLPLFAFDVLGVPASRAGFTSGLFGLAGALSRIAWGFAGDRMRRTSGVLVGIAAAAALATLLVVGADMTGAIWMLWAGAGLAGATAPVWNALAMFEVAKAVGRERLGRASGVVFSGFFSGYTVAPVMLGWLIDRTESYAYAWIIVSVLFAAGAVAALGWHRIAVRAELPVV